MESRTVGQRAVTGSRFTPDRGSREGEFQPAQSFPSGEAEDEGALRNRDWVERNLRYVTEKTGGRVAYVYVTNTTTLGYDYFRRYFFPQADRQAIIIDERHNAGGQAADYYLDFLRRPFMSYWAHRYGADLRTPLAAIQGPKVMIINEMAGSGGDLMPYMFRRRKIGTLVGKRTWGGLVHTADTPAFVDGGSMIAPRGGFFDRDGKWAVENEGVPPDIDVEQSRMIISRPVSCGRTAGPSGEVTVTTASTPAATSSIRAPSSWPAARHSKWWTSAACCRRSSPPAAIGL